MIKGNSRAVYLKIQSRLLNIVPGILMNAQSNVPLQCVNRKCYQIEIMPVLKCRMLDKFN